MEQASVATRYFVAALLLSCLIISPLPLDLTLTARFTAFSLSLLPVLYHLYKRHKTFSLRVDAVLLAYMAYAVCCIISLCWARVSSEALFESAKVILALLAFCFTYYCLKQDAVFFTERLQKGSVVVFFILLMAAGSEYLKTEQEGKEALYAITGLNGHKNLYASFLFLNLFFLIGAAYRLKGEWRIGASIAIFLSLCVLLLIRTKAVWIGLSVTVLAGTVLYFYSAGRVKFRFNAWIVIVFCMLCANVFFMYGLRPLIKKALLQEEAASMETGFQLPLDHERLLIWDKTYDMIHNHPLLGAGMGNWQVLFPDATLSGLWRVEDLNYTFQRPHNDFLWILSETGLLGFNVFLFFLIALLVFAVKAAKHVTTGSWRQGPLPAVAFITGFFAISFFDFPKERMEHLLWLNVICGIAYYHICERGSVKPVVILRVGKTFFIVLAILLLFIACFGMLRHKGEYYTRAMLDRSREKRHADIIREGKSAISFAYTLDPTSVPIAWYLGNAYAATGDYGQAYRQLQKAYGLNPYNRHVLNDLASAHVMHNNITAAKQLYLEASRISPRFDDPKLNLVAIYINEQNYSAASECIRTLRHDSERRSQYQKIIDAFFPAEKK